jgi:hypothetical protein
MDALQSDELAAPLIGSLENFAKGAIAKLSADGEGVHPSRRRNGGAPPGTIPRRKQMRRAPGAHADALVALSVHCRYSRATM